MDTGTGLVALATAMGGKDFLMKLLGPTADYMGDELKLFTEKRVENIKRIFINAQNKIKEDNEGTIPPRVLKDIINDGSFSSDDLFIEYYGGVLSSSKTGISRDDRATTFMRIINSLSTYQLRTHYLIYKMICDLNKGCNIDIGTWKIRNSLSLYVPGYIYANAMDCTHEELKIISQLVNHSIIGLANLSLIDNDFLIGDIGTLKNKYALADTDGFIIQPTMLGFELFSVVHGLSNIKTSEVFLNDYEISEHIPIADGYCMINKN